jgi:hypothetical protein
MTVVHAASLESKPPRRPRNRSSADVIATGCAVLCAALVGCGGDEAAARQEARELLAQVNAIEDDETLENRKKQLDALQLLPLRHGENRAARDACYAAHHGLWRAEVEQASAKVALDAAEKHGAAQGAPVARPAVDPGVLAAEAIEKSNRALEDAQKHFPACETAMQRLIARAR